MPDRLFDREVVINVGGLRIASRLLDETQRRGLPEDVRSNILKVTFGGTKTLKKEPNKATVSIYNLGEQSRVALQERGQNTIVEAGYVGSTSILFDGTLEYSNSVYNGSDWVTTLETSDGTDKTKSNRVNKSFKGPVKATAILQEAARALGVKSGNLRKAIARGSVRGNLSEFSNGYVMSGKADAALDSIARSMGYFYSIQDGQLLLLAQDDFLGNEATLLSSSTGMVGSPEPGDDGFIKVRSLVQANLLPAHRVEVDSKSASGFYRIERVDYSLDTWGDDWYADLECRPLGGA